MSESNVGVAVVAGTADEAKIAVGRTVEWSLDEVANVGLAITEGWGDGDGDLDTADTRRGTANLFFIRLDERLGEFLLSFKDSLSELLSIFFVEVKTGKLES